MNIERTRSRWSERRGGRKGFRGRGAGQAVGFRAWLQSMLVQIDYSEEGGWEGGRGY